MENSLIEPHCNHFVIRKKRYCRMTVKTGEKYCGEHQINSISEGTSANQSNKKRIICPLDPKHTCYESKLKKHLKKCNAKSVTDILYIQKNINVPEGEAVLENRCLSKVPIQQLLEVIRKVNTLHSEIIKNSITEKYLTHSILEDELTNPNYGLLTKKHLQQASSILGLLKEYGLLQSDTCFIEFGAGRGKLSYWLSKTLELLGFDSSKVLLIERASHRHKCENKLDNTLVKVLRIRADIADLILSKVEAVNESKHIIGVTKHLCGDGTDLALNCLINCQKAGKDVSGMVMTFCCLHRCRWSTYTGRHYFEEIGIASEDFDVMCSLVSWAVCGSGQGREKRKSIDECLNYTERDLKIGLSRSEKEIVGRKCKDLINWGRKEFLQRLGFKCDLCHYVKNEVSLENICMVVTKEKL
ncbi:hypothetical protein FQR65_LT08580 [Abscondita terminalis]|nr:hypothetical protein FQR65_LT08580 [Abscondita terminalis]